VSRLFLYRLPQSGYLGLVVRAASFDHVQAGQLLIVAPVVVVPLLFPQQELPPPTFLLLGVPPLQLLLLPLLGDAL